MIVIDESKLSPELLGIVASVYGYVDVDKFLEERHFGLESVVEAIDDLNGLIKKPFWKD